MLSRTGNRTMTRTVRLLYGLNAMVMSERLELRLPEDALNAIDEWRAGQEDAPTRSEAIRQLIEKGLPGAVQPIGLSPGEKLITLMLSDVYKAVQSQNKALKIHGEFDPDLLKEIVGSGHLWALRQEYSWVTNRDQDEPEVVEEVFAILEMWDQLEGAVADLKPAERGRIATETKNSTPEQLKFWGFDGNNERHYGIARFVIGTLKRFDRFSQRDINSHRRVIDQYRRMLTVFKQIEPTIEGKELNVDQIIQILAARFPSGQRNLPS